MFKILLLCLVGTALCQVQQVIDNVEDHWAPNQIPGHVQINHIPVQIQESPASRYLGLSSGASAVVPNIRTSFSCVGRRYGYFADVDNNCQIFHVCQPSVTATGAPVIYHFSKFCPQNTRFDQRALTCVPETSSELIPCRDSIRFYPLVENRFAENQIPIAQRVEQLPEQVVEQRHEATPFDQFRHDVIPTKSILRSQAITNVIPTKSIVRNVIQPVVQHVQQPIVQHSIPIVTRKVAPVAQVVQRIVPAVVKPQLVSPVVSHFRKVNPVPVLSSAVHPGIPAQYLTHSQALPSAAIQQTIAQPVVQTVGQPLIQQRGVNIVPTQGVQQIVAQPIEQRIEQSVEAVVPQAVAQPVLAPVDAVQARADSLVQRPAQTLPGPEPLPNLQ